MQKFTGSDELLRFYDLLIFGSSRGEYRHSADMAEFLRHLVLQLVDFTGWGECRHTARRVLEWNPSL